MYDIGFVTVGSKKVPVNELMQIVEFGSASHRFPATGVYKKIKAKYTDEFNKVLTDSLFKSFDSIVNYSTGKFGKKSTGIMAK